MTMDVAAVATQVGPRASYCVQVRLQQVARGANTSPEVANFALTLVALLEGKPRLDQLRRDILALLIVQPGLTPQRLAAVLRPRQQHVHCLPLWTALGDLVITIGALATADHASFQAEVRAISGDHAQP